MSRTTTVLLVAGALVAGLVLGSATLAFAGADPTATPGGGLGARVGGICRQAGASLADVVAKLTGQTPDQVRAERAKGTSFADIAASKGVSADQVQSSALDARSRALAAAVKAGTITQAQADSMAARMKARLGDRIASPAPAGCDGAGAGAGCGMGGGRGAGNGAGACGGGACGGGGCGSAGASQ